MANYLGKRYSVQERGQPWPSIIGDISIPMRWYYELFVRPFFEYQQRRNPWHWRIWDAAKNDWLRWDYNNEIREFQYEPDAYGHCSILNFSEEARRGTSS